MKEMTIIILLIINIIILLTIGNSREEGRSRGINPPPKSEPPKHPGRR